VEVSIALADAKGLDNLAMRDIAHALGSSPMSLYRHVASKEDLIDLMMDSVAAEQDLANIPTGKWESDLKHLGAAHRSTLLAHSWATRPPVRPLLGPEALRRFDIALSIFPESVPISRRAWAVHTIDAFVRGSVAAELAERFEIERTGIDKSQWQQAVAPYMTRMLASGQFPHVDCFIRVEEADPEEQFQLGLEAVLGGVRNVIGQA
jgi:AcrR family transcriptional regulator